MIKKRDLWLTNLTLYVLSKLGLLPIDYNWEPGQIRVATINDGTKTSTGNRTGNKSGLGRVANFRWKILIWKFWFLNGLLYGLYTKCRLFQSIVWGEYVEIHHLACHIIMSSLSTVDGIWDYILFMRNPAENEAIFNTLHISDQGEFN